MRLFDMLLLPFLVLGLASRVISQAPTTQSFWPVAVPLAVRTPYLSSWMFNVSYSTFTWPVFWDRQTLGWIALIRVNGTTYELFGNSDQPGPPPSEAASLSQMEVTPTRTIQMMKAGPLDVKVTFLSPIEASDWVRQSLPFAYMAIEFNSTSGQSYDVQLYSDITGEWLSGDRSQEMTWSYTETESVIYHQLELEEIDTVQFQENGNQAIDGRMYYAMQLGQGSNNISWQSCGAVECRNEFTLSGGLNTTNNNNMWRAIDVDWPVAPIAVSLSNVNSTSSPIVWTIGYVRDPSIEYTLFDATESLSPYYTTQYSNISDAIEFFASDFDNAMTNAEALDGQLQQAALEISPDGKYFNLLSLAARQAFGSIEIMAPRSVGQSSTSARIFMKNVGTDNRANPVEILYASLPMFLHLNASLVEALLVPLLEQQNASLGSGTNYAAKDLGTAYPVVSGVTSEAAEGVEQSGNMLIMVLAYAQSTQDFSLLRGYYNLLKTWADYLKGNNMALYPSNQTSASGNKYNSTNLAIKGIIGIQAMAEISQLVGENEDSLNYSTIASQYANTWQSLAVSSHGSEYYLTPTYANSLYWTLGNNLYAQPLLKLNLVNQSVFDGLSQFFAAQLNTADAFTYGLPYGSQANSNNIGNSAWTAQTASFLSTTAREQLLTRLWNYTSFNETWTSGPFATTFNVQTGALMNGTASPAQGALFAPLLINDTFTVSSSPKSSHSRKLGAILGGVLGSVFGLAAICVVALLIRRWSRRQFDRIAMNSGTELSPFDLTSAGVSRTAGPTEKRQSLPRGDHPQVSAGGTAPSSDFATAGSPQGTRDGDLLGLRMDIQELQRTMRGLRVEQLDTEAPPSYVPE